MPEVLQNVVEALGQVSGRVFSLLPMVGVIIVLTLTGRILSGQSQRTSKLRFRNQLIMAGVIFVGILVIIVVLPIDAGVRGQLLTLVGIITSVSISLSSSTFLGNALAGVMLKTMRNFRSGDFIKVGEHLGRVTERGLFHTEIQTPSRDLMTLPNLFLATTPVTVVRSSGTIVDATVSLGYDIPHEKVEPLLTKAASDAGLSDAFVQILELGDYAVTYRAAGLLVDTKRLLTFRSRLRVAMLDCLHKANIEIISPEFRNVRDFDTQHEFIPQVSDQRPKESLESQVDVIFDKAEEAESLASLHYKQEKLEARAKELKQRIKEASDHEPKKHLAEEAEQIESEIAISEKLITEAEEREKKDTD